MLTFKTIIDNDMLHIIENKDVADNIKCASDNVLVIFTQDWCSDWHLVEQELRANENIDRNVFVFVCMYNQSPLYEKFMEFKESVWNNALIPYLRYYKNGAFVKDSNHMPFQRIMRVFE